MTVFHPDEIVIRLLPGSAAPDSLRAYVVEGSYETGPTHRWYVALLAGTQPVAAVGLEVVDGSARKTCGLLDPAYRGRGFYELLLGLREGLLKHPEAKLSCLS